MLRVLRRQSAAYYATQPTNLIDRGSAFSGSDISCSRFVCAKKNRLEQQMETAVHGGARSHVPLRLLMCSVKFLLPIICDNIPSGNENLASLARPYFPKVWFSLVNQTVFRERACARERGRGGRKNTVWPNWPGFRGISYLASRSRCDQSDYWYAVII